MSSLQNELNRFAPSQNLEKQNKVFQHQSKKPSQSENIILVSPHLPEIDNPYSYITIGDQKQINEV